MRRDLITGLLAVVVLTLVFGVAYPLVVTGVAQVAFPGRANGSKITVKGRTVGSRLIGQDFRVPVIGKDGKPEIDKESGDPVLTPNPRYFQERPSTGTSYAADATAFTNLGPNSADARDAFRSSLDSYLQLEGRYNPGLAASAVPVDAVTSSASGVDPQISPANAAIQARRIAAIRRLPLESVRSMIAAHTDRRFVRVLGEPGVNVLELNLSLDHLTP